MKKTFHYSILVICAFAIAACGSEPVDTGMRSQDFGPDANEDGHVRATDATVAAQEAYIEGLPISDTEDFELVKRGLIARDEGLQIKSANGKIVWDAAGYAKAVDRECPPSVNPSLWRQAQLNSMYGLFEVTDRIYQVRGYDLANMTVIEGDTGRILIDPLTATETARAALDLVERELGERPITAIIYTHSHIDHFGGVKGVISQDDVDSGKTQVIAPLGFMEEAVSENVLAGIVMGRRAQYMYGMPLAHGERGHIDSGLGQKPARGTHTIIAPTTTIGETGETLTIDGVEIEFQYTPESEAPAEMIFYFPQFKALCGAEIVSRTMHNLYTLRGTKVRDALKWSGYIDEAARRYADKTDVLFNSHHWPVWGQDEIREYLTKQRDTYKFIHDQTLRLASHGMTPKEIAVTIELPSTLKNTFANRGYYGTIEHNSKAVYQFYFGWYDSNPVNLNPHPPAEEAPRYVEAMGGIDAVVTKAQAAYDEGDYRWAARLLNHGVFAAPDNDAARSLLAQTYDQLGYQAESGPWRDVYLTAARELRKGIVFIDTQVGAGDILNTIPLDQFFMAMATRLNAEKADGKVMTFNFNFTDTDQQFVLRVENAVLHHREAEPVENADATVDLTRAFWLRLTSSEAGLREMIFSDEFNVQGDRLALLSFFGLLDRPRGDFAIVTP